MPSKLVLEYDGKFCFSIYGRFKFSLRLYKYIVLVKIYLKYISVKVQKYTMYYCEGNVFLREDLSESLSKITLVRVICQMQGFIEVIKVVPNPENIIKIHVDSDLKIRSF